MVTIIFWLGACLAISSLLSDFLLNGYSCYVAAIVRLAFLKSLIAAALVETAPSSTVCMTSVHASVANPWKSN